MLKHWKFGLKNGLSIFAVFLAALFVYGLYNDFVFWHAFAHAGTQSGIAYMIYYGVFAGPVVIVLVAFSSMYVKNLNSQ